MGRLQLLRVVVGLSGGLLLLTPAWAAAADDQWGCGPANIASESCSRVVSVRVGVGEVSLGAEVNRPGSGGPGGGSGGTGAGGGSDVPPSTSDPRCVRLPQLCDVYTITSADQIPPLSLSDVAGFVPVVPVAGMQPSWWAVVGLETNFFVAGGPQVVEGVLLGQPARVRFTPVLWRWDYGDGNTAQLTTAGGKWKQLGVEEFDQTAASHVYETRGDYRARVTVDFAVEYSIAGSRWRDIEGVVSVEPEPLIFTAWNVKTVLVSEDCITNPKGIGCHNPNDQG
ncbi:MAG: hypothetical protein ACRCSP_00075 [Rhodoglobus sp.]